MKRMLARALGDGREGRLWTWWRVAGLALMVVTIAAIALAAGCSQTKAPAPEGELSSGSDASDAQQPVSPDTELAKIAKAYKNAAAVIETSKGTIKLKLFAADAPVTVNNFAKLANSKFYDGLKWHRWVPGFVIQGGDPYSKTGEGPVGSGGPGYTIPAEFNSHKHVLGSVAMARSTDPNSAGSQFYITLAPQPGLDNQYTVFGQVTSGIDVVLKLRGPRDQQQVTMAMLKNADTIKSVRVVGIAR